MDTEQTRGSYITGLLGAIVGALIASLPWILCYIFLNMIMSLLAIPIAMGAYYGYKLCKGPIGKPCLFIVIIVTLMAVALANFVIIPAYYLMDANLPVNFTYLKWLLSSKEVMAGMMKDFIVSVIFALLGISGTIRSIQNEVIQKELKDAGYDDAAIEQNIERMNTAVKPAINPLKEILIRNGAVNKENTMSKQQLYEESGLSKMAFLNARLYYLVRKSHGGYYYDVEAESNAGKNAAVLFLKVMKIMAVTIISLLVIIFIAIMFSN